MILGTRIPSAQTTAAATTTTNIPNHLIHNSTNVFRSKHCVSREDESPREIPEPQIINDEPLDIPIKRTVQVRMDYHPIYVPSISPSSDMLVNSDVSENPPLVNESTIIKTIDDTPNESFEYTPIRRSKSAFVQPGISSIVTLPPLPSSNFSLVNNRKDLLNLSHTSFSTSNSNQPHIVTGSAVIVRARSPTKSALNKQRIKIIVATNKFKNEVCLI